MTYYHTSPDEFINHPQTVSLVIDNEVVASSRLEENPFVLLSKPLTGGYVVAYVREGDLNRAVADIRHYTGNIYPFVLAPLGVTDLDASGFTQVQRRPALQLKGRGVLLGFVDTGINYTLSAFRTADGKSRIQSIWDQSIRGNPPNGYLYGAEYTNGHINEALNAKNPYAVVPHRDTVGHGTFLASAAASGQEGEAQGAAPEAEIIAVKLRSARPADRNRYLIANDLEPAFSSDDLMLGVQYIVDKALALHRPAVICIAVGTNSGTRDGFSKVETYLSKVSGILGMAVCCAAGNEGQARHHMQGRIKETGATKKIELQAGEKAGDVYVIIENYASDRLSVSVQSPTGERIDRAPARSGSSYRNKLTMERSTVDIEYLFPTEGAGGQVTRIKLLNATPGIWSITVYGDAILDGSFHAYLPITGLGDAGTFFLESSPNYTVVTPASALGVIACGAYDTLTNSLYASSSWGPTLLPSSKPDLVAPGVQVGGLYPTGPGKMSGTSVAAAITAGACALLLEWGIVKKHDETLNSYRLRANLIAGCARDENIDYPNSMWGYGRLDLAKTFQALRAE